MAYRPTVGDTVQIKNYTGMMHPNTVYDVTEVRDTISKIVVHQSTPHGVLGFTNETWVETERLIHVKLVKTA